MNGQEKVEALFEAARKLPDSKQRQAFLEAECAGDASLRSRVEALLSAGASAEKFFADCSLALNLISSQEATQPEQPVPDTIRVPLMTEQSVGARIGRYKLLENIGEGGCGVVYVAEQEEPVRRRVALKLIKPGMDSKQVVARFEAERQALAMMDHPNIAKVLDAGTTEEGRPYFVMELVRGLRITEYADRHRLNPTQRLELFAQVCRAVQHAHQKGIIHRDLKPSNILVTLHDGAPVPKVIDFGIAKALQGRLTELTLYTELRQFIGTPAYMSPEQAEMSGMDIDTRSDIYSLGVLLYELLTGRTPFDAKELLERGLDEVRRTLREVEPVRPSTRLSTLTNADLSDVANSRHTEAPKLVALVRGDLDWIVMKCLEKDRTRRYETANGLALDVRRFLNQEPVIARPPSAIYRLQKFALRHRIAFTAGSAVLLALVLGLGATSWALVREHAARRDVELSRQSEKQQRLKAEKEELMARQFAYASDINLAQQALGANNLGRARELLERNRPKSGQSDLRGWEWRYLWKHCQSDALFRLCRLPESVLSLTLAQDQRTLVLRNDQAETQVWDLIARKRTAVLGWGGQSRALAGCRPANLIAFSTTNGSGRLVVEILNMSSNSSIAQIQNVGDPVSLDFSPDGSKLAIFSDNPGIQLWDSGTKETTLLTMAVAAGGSHKGVVLFSPDGNLLAIGSTEGSIQIFDARTRVEQFRFKAFADGISALAFSPDGELLASGAGFSEQQIKLWNVSTGTAAGELVGHRSWITTLAFAPDGKTLVSGSGDQTIRFWDISSRREVGVLCGHQNEIYTLALANDGHTLVSGSKDGEVCIWDTTHKHENEGYSTAITPVRYVRFLPHGGGFISLDRDNSVGVWDGATMQETRRIAELGSDNLGISISPDGKLVATGDPHGKLKFWDLAAGQELTNFTFQNVPSWPGRFLDNGKVLQVFDESVVVHFLEIGSWKQTSQWKMPAGVSALAMAPDEQVMAVGYKMGIVRVIHVADGRELVTLPAHSRWITGTIFTPDGKLLVTSSEDGLVKLWDPSTYSQLATLKGHLLGVHSVAASSDSRRLVTGSNAKEAVKIWDLATRQELINLEGEGSQFDHTQFSPDGDVLLSINSEGVLHYWRAPSMAEINARAMY